MIRFKTLQATTVAGALILSGWVGANAQAKPLGEATVTQVNKDVRYKATEAKERPAKLKDVVRGTDVLTTGQQSQAELEFADTTLTRLGSNSIFTFDPEKRELNLKSGVLLFDMQKGLGGARIKTAAITAAIEGTAGIVANKTAPQIICLAGLIRILGDRGQTLALLRPGDTFLNGRVFQIELRGLRGGKLLVRGLPHSQKEFDDAAAKQVADIQSGELVALNEQGQELDNAKLTGQPFTTGIESLRGRETPRVISTPATHPTTVSQQQPTYYIKTGMDKR